MGPTDAVGDASKTHESDTVVEQRLMTRMGNLAVDMGAMYSPNGFRVLSNFGRDGMQSQAHGHIHVIGGTNLGPYA